ncbi:MAG: homoserine O-acetyltransferase [Myxococcota bacterium]|nr:homoserine O-acetyltransferase [Myxococcota bacterium]
MRRAGSSFPDRVDSVLGESIRVVEHDVGIGSMLLASGDWLTDVVQRVTLCGAQPAADGSNVALMPHALTGSSRVFEWWKGFVGSAACFDPCDWCIVGVNALGGCYGSTGPTSLAADGRHWGPRFPVVSVEDMVNAQRRALEALGITRVAVVAGGSLGGFQALQWARSHGSDVGHAIVIGASDHLRAQAIAQNALARDAIALDPAFSGGWYEEQPRDGLRLARAIATLTYKSESLFEERFSNRADRRGGDPARSADARFDVEGYLAYQGERFAVRMDANAYRTLTRAMDLFDLRGREQPARASRLTFVGLLGDQLFRPDSIAACAQRWADAGWDARFLSLETDHGHDAFLAEARSLGSLVSEAMC